jgi:hypothetical protein
MQSKQIPMRPLHGGMVKDRPTEQLPAGSFLELKNLIVHRKGLMRRPGLDYFMSSNAVGSDDQPIVGIAPVWKTDGTQFAVCLTNRYLYQVSAYSSPTAYYWTYTTGTIAVSSTTVTGSGTAWDTAASKIRPNDVMVLDANGSGDGPEYIEILSITNDTTVTLKSAPTGTYGAGTDYAIRRRFNVSNSTLLDWTVSDNKLVITDHDRYGLYSYDGTTFTEWDTYAEIPYKFGCVVYFKSRLWGGRIIDGSGNYYHQRIRWSSAADRTSFPAVNYLDLDYFDGALRRLVPMGDLLIGYFADAIWYGRQTNNPNLPVSFDPFPTGGVGLVGPRAVVEWLNGHFYVGQDDIYYLSNNGPEAIGSQVVSDTIDTCSTPDRIYAALDQNNERIVFGFPVDGEDIEKVWSYAYKLKSWSYDEISCTSISNPQLDLNLTWGDLSTVLTGAGEADTWTGLGNVFFTGDSISAGSSSKDLFFSEGGYIYKLSSSSPEDESGGIVVEIQTPDMDFDTPDMDKSILQVSIKLDRRPAQAITFAVSCSVDQGENWTSEGNLVIPTTAREGKIDFLRIGSTIRIKLISSTSIAPYFIKEIGMTVRGHGREFLYD